MSVFHCSQEFETQPRLSSGENVQRWGAVPERADDAHVPVLWPEGRSLEDYCESLILRKRLGNFVPNLCAHSAVSKMLMLFIISQ